MRQDQPKGRPLPHDAPKLRVPRTEAEAGFELPKGLWRIQLDAPAGVWTAGEILCEGDSHPHALAIDNDLLFAATRSQRARFLTRHGDACCLSFYRLDLLRGLAALAGAAVSSFCATPRAALNRMWRSLPAARALIPVWRKPPFAAFDRSALSAGAYVLASDLVARPLQGEEPPRQLNQLRPDEAIFCGATGDRLYPGALSRILEALRSAPVVTWDQSAPSGRRGDEVLHPARAPFLPAAFDRVGDAWAVRAGELRTALTQHANDIEAARRHLLATRLHIHETLSQPVQDPAIPHQGPARPANSADPLDVSIIIPTRDRPAHLRACLEILKATQPGPREIILVDHRTEDPEAVALIDQASAEGATVVRAEGPFNFSRLVNIGATHASSRYLCLLNNDVTARTPDWLAALCEAAESREVGVVGAELHFPDGRLQHAGIVNSTALGLRHAGLGLGRGDRGPQNLLDDVREVLGVTGACLLTPRSLYAQLKGFDEAYPSDYNDIDYCLRAREAGYRVLCTPRATLIHDEGATRGRRSEQDEAQLARLKSRHNILDQIDPYFSPRCESAPPHWRLRKLRP